jgi:hypothetical protein
VPPSPSPPRTGRSAPSLPVLLHAVAAEVFDHEDAYVAAGRRRRGSTACLPSSSRRPMPR